MARAPAVRSSLGALTGAALLVGAVVSGCGQTSSKILERIDAATPPGSNLRMDVFVVRSATTCAIGPACASASAAQCFTLSDATGPRIMFDPDQVQYVPQNDPRLAAATRSQCFRLALSAAEVASVRDLTAALRTQVFQLTGGEMNLDIRLHDVASVDTEFSRYEGGVFLSPRPITAIVQPLVSRDTDFTYVVTGYRDPDTGITPTMNECAGTGIPVNGAVGSAYSWIGLSNRCIQETAFLSTFMLQLSFAMSDVVQFPDLYDSAYPPCGAGNPDPALWFPRSGDCTWDPDAPTCGQAFCPDWDTFYAHILSTHWPRGRIFNGNYCSDGRMDFDETAVDQGGACDLIGR